MGVREALERRRPLITGAAGTAILLAIGVAVWEGRSPIPGPITKAYYTDDDGKTYFVDEADKICPFDHNGKPAYAANVFQCAGGSPFVAFLTRVNDAAKPQLEALKATPGGAGSADYVRTLNGAIEVRRPGEKAWAKLGTPAYQKVLDFPCPNGGSDPHSVSP